MVQAESSSIHLGTALTTRECQDTRHKRVEMQVGRQASGPRGFLPALPLLVSLAPPVNLQILSALAGCHQLMEMSPRGLSRVEKHVLQECWALSKGMAATPLQQLQLDKDAASLLDQILQLFKRNYPATYQEIANVLSKIAQSL